MPPHNDDAPTLSMLTARLYGSYRWPQGYNQHTLMHAKALTVWQMDAKLPHIFKWNNIIRGHALCLNKHGVAG